MRRGDSRRRVPAMARENYSIALLQLRVPERIARRIPGLPDGAMPAFHAWYLKGGEELPPPNRDALRDELRAFWENPQSRAALQSLGLRPNEPLLLLRHP